jgi:D-serine deaminase-like pyridoxal phosphate-dependent protein
MRTVDDLPTPALLLDLDVLERNLRNMSERADQLGVALRPHVKTHKCLEVASGQRALGVSGMTVSTLYEARMFAEHGFDDLTGTSVIDAGALALSLDPGPAHVGRRSFGRLYDDYGKSRLRQNARIVSLTQEHGVVNDALPVGARTRILPNHSCLTVACFEAFFVVRGDEILDSWKIWCGR